MPVVSNQDSLAQSLFDNYYVLLGAKGAILLILVFYAIFSLVIIRQVDSMNKTLLTRVSPIVKALAILHAGFAIGIIVLAWGLL